MRDKPKLRWRASMVASLALLSACGGDEAPVPASPSAPSEAPVASDAAATDAPANAAPADTAAISASTDAPAQVSPSDTVAEEAPAATPAPSEWTSEVQPVEGETVADILRRADEALAVDRLDQGPESALGLYLQALEAEPDNEAAKTGLDGVAQALIERAQTALTAGELDRVRAALPALRRLRPEDVEVKSMQARVEEADRIAKELIEAQRRFDAGQLVDPPNASAASIYVQILLRDPQQPDAQAGLMRIETELVAQATAAAEAGDYARSDKLLADAARARPGSGGVQDAGSQIVEMRQSRANELLQQARAAAMRGQVERAEQLLAQLEQVSAQAQGIEELRELIELARLYGGYAPGQTITDALSSGGDGPELVVLPVGSFQMGSPSSEAQRKKEEGPQHEVRFARGFALGKTEITVAQFGAFVRASGYRSSAQQRGRSSIYDERSGNLFERDGIDWERDYTGRTAAPDLPVVHVSWDDAQAFADWLARETGKAYRLPSESELEYALRANSETRYPWGDGSPDRLVENLTGANDTSSKGRGWTNGFVGYGDKFWGPAPVGSFAANRFGLHDANGNVSEWSVDCWHESYSRAPADGSAWVNPGCNRRVIRGASWASAPDQARSAFRVAAAPATTHARVGFRVARDL